jgi:hypothetical protein
MCVVCDNTGWVCDPCDADHPPDMSRTGMKVDVDDNGPRH